MNYNALIDRRLNIAPMMGYTDQHCRALFHMICPDVLVYTEMVTTGALLHGDRERLLTHSSLDSPCALQLGGSDPQELAECAKMAEDRGYQEVNLNIGCPSDRVQRGTFGACLMANPELVAESVNAMNAVVQIPVTVKCRIGIDDQDSYEFFNHFVDRVNQGGCTIFIVHARKAILKGLSPRENREIPPLHYDYVYQLKSERPDLSIVLNGGLTTREHITAPLEQLDGVMIGRAAMKNPMCIASMAELSELSCEENPHSVFDQYLKYASQQCNIGESLSHLTRHLLNLFPGRPGARRYRRYLSEEMHQANFSLTMLEKAAGLVTSEVQVPC